MVSRNKDAPLLQAASFVSSKAAKPMLSLVMTRFNMSFDPSALASASWLNSIKWS